MRRKLNQKTASARVVKGVAMNFTRGRENYAARSEIAPIAIIEFGQAAFEYEIKRGEVVRMSWDIEERWMTGFRPPKTGDFLFAQVILTQAPHWHGSLVILRSKVFDYCRHVASRIVCV